MSTIADRSVKALCFTTDECMSAPSVGCNSSPKSQIGKLGSVTNFCPWAKNVLALLIKTARLQSMAIWFSPIGERSKMPTLPAAAATSTGYLAHSPLQLIFAHGRIAKRHRPVAPTGMLFESRPGEIADLSQICDKPDGESRPPAPRRQTLHHRDCYR